MEPVSFNESFSRLCDLHARSDLQVFTVHRRLARHRHRQRLKKTMYNALFQHMPDKPSENQPSCDLTDLDEVYSRGYAMRCVRRFGDASKLEESVEGFLSDGSEDKRNVLRFLLCLADTGGATEATDFGNRQIQLPALLYKRVAMLPVHSDFCHGDAVSMGVSSDHRFTVYPRELFEMPPMKEAIPWQNTGSLDAQIFERIPGTSLQGHVVFNAAGSLNDTYESQRSLTLFGALNRCRDNDLEMTLELPEMSSGPTRIIPPKLQDLSNDEGFEDARSEPSRPASPVDEAASICEPDQGQDVDNVWHLVIEATPLKHYVWEATANLTIPLQRPYLTEAGPAVFDRLLDAHMEQLRLVYPSIYVIHRQTIAMTTLVADAVNLLIGVSSNTFLYNKDVRTFRLNENISVSGLSSEALGEVCGALIECGTNYSRLRDFSESPAHASAISRAFCSAVWKYLQHYCGFVLSLPRITSVLQLNFTVHPVAAQIRFLAELCYCAADSGDSQLPTDVPLLSYVYTHTLQECSSQHYPMMLSLLTATCVPYVVFLQDWIFHGVCRDKYGEFMVQVNDDFLVRRDNSYWQSGYKLVLPEDADSMPLFLAGMMDDIFTCGKSINLLRLISPRHFLFSIEHAVPRVMITFSQDELVDIEAQCHEYLLCFQRAAKDNERSRNEAKLQAEQAKHDRHVKARKLAVEAIEKVQGTYTDQQIQETVETARRLEDSRKRELFAELKDQMEKTLERKALNVAQLQEEDRRLAEAARKRPWMQTEVSEHIEKAAREELIEKYAKLTDAATYRERKAMWQVERHRLDAKRFEYLQREDGRLTEELQQRPLVPISGAGDAVDSSQLTQTKDATNLPVTSGDSALQTPKPPPDGATVECVDVASEDVLPKWARAKGTESDPNDSQSDSELPKWAREADSDPSMSLNEDGLPKWATKWVTGATEEEKQDRDVLESESAKVSGFAEEPLSEIDGLKPARDGDIKKQSSGDVTKQSSGDVTKQSSGDITKQSSGDITKQSSGDITKLSSGDIIKQSSRDTIKQSCGTVTHPAVGSTEQPSTVPSRRHPSDSTVGDQLYPEKHVADVQGISHPGDNVDAIDQSPEVAVGSTSDAPQVPPPAVDAIPGSEISDIPSTSHTSSVGDNTHNIDDVTLPKTPQEMEMTPHESLPATTPHESVPAVIKPSFFGYASQLAGLDYAISVPKTKPPKAMQASTESSQWKDFTVQCHRRRFVDGQSVNAETQEVTSHRPIIKFNRRFGASTESEYVDASIAKMKRFRELNRHDKHSSDSSIQKLLYGKAFGGIHDAQLIDEGDSEEEREDMELWADTCVELYQDNYDHLGDAPAVNLMSKMSEHTLVEQYGFATGDNIDVHKYMPLSCIISRSVVSPLTAQVKVVNESILSHFNVDLDIDRHFRALQHFLLLSDGEFSQSLTDQLFDKLSEVVEPQEMLNHVYLNGVLAQALQYSLRGDSEYAKNVSFSLKYIPQLLKRNTIDALDCLDLTYKVAWPLNIVITDACIVKYSRVCSFMLQLKRISWVTSDLWHKIKRDGLVSRADRSTEYRQLQLFRHEMMHFVKVMQSYIANQIIEISWHEFQQDLATDVHNLDDLHRVHVKYLNKCIYRCLLTPNATRVMKVIRDIFTLILKFHTQLHLQSWQRDEGTGEMRHPLFDGMCKSYRAFNDYSTFFFKVVNKLAARGYQPQLQELVLRLDFNNYYSSNVRLTQSVQY